MAAAWDQKYIQASIIYIFFFFSAVIRSSQAGQKAFTTYVQKFQRQINHIPMPTNTVSMGTKIYLTGLPGLGYEDRAGGEGRFMQKSIL